MNKRIFVCLLVIIGLVAAQISAETLVNKALSASLVSIKEDGTLNAIYEEWFDTTAPGTVGNCDVTWPEKSELLQELFGKDSILFGYVPYTPFVYANDSSTVLGFDVDVVAELIARISVQYNISDIPVKWVEVNPASGGSFPALVSGLEKGDYDVIFSGLTITEARKEDVDFGCAYFEASIGVASNGTEFDTIESLNSSDVSVCFIAGTTWESAADQLEAATKIKVASEAELYQHIIDGTASACIYDKPALEYYAAFENAAVKVQPIEIGTPQTFGFATKKAAAPTPVTEPATPESPESPESPATPTPVATPSSASKAVVSLFGFVAVVLAMIF